MKVFFESKFRSSHVNGNLNGIEDQSTECANAWGHRLVYKILVERPLVLILVVVATIQMWKYLKMGQ